MKRIIQTTILFLFLATTLVKGDNYVKQYQKMRKTDKEFVLTETINEKGIKHMIDSIRQELKHSYNEESAGYLDFLKNTKELSFFIDPLFSETEMEEKANLDKLAKGYEELLTVEQDELYFKALAKMQKSNIKELVLDMDMEDMKFIVSIDFKKPIKPDQWKAIMDQVKVNDEKLSEVIAEDSGIAWQFDSFDNVLLYNGEKTGIKIKDGSFFIPSPERIENISEEFTPLIINDKLGLVDKQLNLILPYEYDDIDVFDALSEEFILLEQKDKYGLADNSGKIVIPVEYDNIDSFDELSEEFILLEKRDKYGLADKNGIIVIPAEYDDINSFDYLSEEFILLEKNEKYGLANINGKLVIPAEYDDIDSFDYLSEEFILLEKKEKYGLANKYGELVIPAEYDDIDSFDYLSEEFILLEKKEKYGLANLKGKIILSAKYDDISSFDELPDEYILIELDEKIGLANKRGDILIKPAYSEINAISDTKLELVKPNDSTSIYTLKKR
ncbi:hypothetical protein M2137_001028 [Parabacteroides sp. PFB2-10]|uniref:WG repeat-containing protein n=1 Tax=Parabacteroides sp. PFB2-10 TaxID=1742405 RepID=UPI00247573DF|nr:WG repeat-containing protein [Parabacteroides sp. PFB2-10]MDH6312258.1 hypothetical protein [Parabacteroides sp. PFB2-10]